MELSYQTPGLVLEKGGTAATNRQVRDLQRHLRQLGYLKQGIDGRFGDGTRRAVMALQHDLLHNVGKSRQGDGAAPVAVLNYNQGRVVQVTGVVDQGLAACLRDLVADSLFPKLPAAQDPVAENKRILTMLRDMDSAAVPVPFLLAILTQESGLRHFNVPAKDDEDTFITVGLDTNATERHIITSRGYGAGQYTLFHHPPTTAEVGAFMLDPVRNVEGAIAELRDKLDHFVNGSTSGTRADDRLREIGNGPLRLCKYAEGDSRHLRDCQNCLADAGSTTITMGVTPFYEGAAHVFTQTQYYQAETYSRVPIRKNIGCDWPYAVRRYNGAGVNSYHYQVRVLLHLLAL
ncbi:MAG: peptidoglycan-binding domain-containing protein [Thermodesulfobacteriota bacterium]